MRNLSALLKLVLFSVFMLAIIGCGESEEPKLDGTGEPPVPGFVWDPDASNGNGSWVRPSSGYDDGNGSDAGYDDEDSETAVVAGSSDDASNPEDIDDGGTDEPAGYGGTGYADDPYAQAQGDPREYTERVEPILRAHCYNCHGGGPRGKKGDIALHSPNAIAEAAVITPNSPASSILFEVISLPRDDRYRMPPQGPGLSNEEKKIIEDWIKQGAVFGNAPADREPYAAADGGTGNRNNGYGGGDGYGTDDPYAASGGDDEEDRPRPAATQPQNLAEFASQSFQAGRDTEAMRQLHAQALVKSDAGNSVLEKYRWVQGLKRAKLAVRWGVGIKYTAKDKFTGSPRAVGVVQNLPGDEYDTVTEQEDGPRDFQNKTLDYYTGDIGKELLLRLQGRIDRSYYGDILKEELSKATSRGDDDEFYDDDDNGGYGGGRGGGGYGGRGGGGGGYGSSGSGEESEKPDGDVVEQLMPGVTLLGQASSGELFKRARQENVDLLVVFDVVADPNRIREFVDTSTRVRLYDVNTEEQVAITGKINNIAIQKTLADEGEDKTVIDEMDKIFEVADKKFRVKEFPNVTSAKAQKSVINFVRGILEHPSKDPLWKLAEVRFYEQRKALKPEHAEAAFKKILPQQSAKLKNVKDDDEIRKILAKWLVVSDTALGSDEEEKEAKPENTFR